MSPTPPLLPPPTARPSCLIFSSRWLSTAGSETLLGVSQPQLPSPCQRGSQERLVQWFWGLSGPMSKLPTSLARITIVRVFWITKPMFLQGSEVAALDLRRKPSSSTTTLGQAEAVDLCTQCQLLWGLTQASPGQRGGTLYFEKVFWL